MGLGRRGRRKKKRKRTSSEREVKAAQAGIRGEKSVMEGGIRKRLNKRETKRAGKEIRVMYQVKVKWGAGTGSRVKASGQEKRERERCLRDYGKK